MFIGHFAVAFAAKRATPRVSLGMLMLAAQWADTLWPVLLAVGLEQVRIVPGHNPFLLLDFVSYPYSHSLAALVIWGIVLGVLYRVIAGGRRTVWVLSALVVSHWLLDVATHVPDMPLYPGGPKYGLGMWNSVPATIAIEVAMYIVGVWIYLKSTHPRDGIGRWGFVSLAVMLVVLYAASLLSGPPPSLTALYIAGIAGFAVLMLWGWWADRHRDAGARAGG